MFVACSMLFVAAIALAPGATWQVPGFESRLKVRADGVTEVTELIHCDFGARGRSGIDRVLPNRLQYPSAGPVDIRIELQTITRGPEIPVPFRLDHQPYYLVVRIGDPDSLMRGEVIYRLRYLVYDGIVAEGDRRSLHWPVVGGEWAADILQVEATVALPVTVDTGEILFDSYTGMFGERGPPATLQAADPQGVTFRAPRGLQAHKQLVVNVSWPGAGTGSGRRGEPRWSPSATLGAVLLVVLLGTIVLVRGLRTRGR